MTSTKVDDREDQEDEKGEEPFGEPIAGCAAITVEDFKAVWPKLPQNRSAIATFIFTMLSIPAFAAIQFFSRSDGSTPAPISWLYVLPVVVFGVTFARGFWKGRVRWAENAVNDSRSLEGVGFRFDAKGITVDAPGRKSTTSWSSLARCLETPEAFAIYTTPTVVMVVPKRAFAAADQPRLRALLAARVPNRPLRGVRKYPIRSLLLWIAITAAFLAIWQLMGTK